MHIVYFNDTKSIRKVIFAHEAHRHPIDYVAIVCVPCSLLTSVVGSELRSNDTCGLNSVTAGGLPVARMRLET